ncbi:MAG TPA: MotA/TolQ/ExbB proton channel family protein [Gemmatimonadaceae bacterium]|nr:MotA/TolQ/ExbB proton channel family protein [Gemmatimonadaceae bacterium]
MTFASLLQIRGAVPATPVELITGATPLTQAVLAILAFLSLLSWAIMFALWRELAKAQRTSLKFFRDFERASRLDEAGALAKVTAPNALTRLFMRAAHFVSDTRVRNQQTRERDAGEATRATATLTGSQVETLHLLLETDAMTERDRLGRFLPWLATIGSVSPLIGLLGTVLGVIDSFIGIATKGSGNLSAVAPGVATALIATAAALAVAIPATFGYNIFAGRLNRFDGMMESFGTATIALLVREGQI